MRQLSHYDNSFGDFRKRNNNKQFLAEMSKYLPRQELTAAIEPYYPNPERAGRRDFDVQRIFRIHFLQHSFELSDPAVEEALYDCRVMHRFDGIELGREPVRNQPGMYADTGRSNHLAREVVDNRVDEAIARNLGHVCSLIELFFDRSQANAVDSFHAFTNGVASGSSGDVSAPASNALDGANQRTTGGYSNSSFVHGSKIAHVSAFAASDLGFPGSGNAAYRAAMGKERYGAL